ncbi:MAG: bifunctional metallophosphatase/5'-nucleotidase [Rhodospirillales bacterium]|nr:MAG: bifunctional metallophosphatase/5'-nucleotidase [Rhodospirillales bacterium]
MTGPVHDLTTAESTSSEAGDVAFALIEEMEPTTFRLQILHASDLEGGVAAIDNAPNFAAIVEALEGLEDNSILLSAGDNWIPGPFYSAAADPAVRPTLQSVNSNLFGLPNDEIGTTLTNLRETGGRIDISIMNAIGFDASALGNHEFDLGTNAIADIIGTDIRGATVGDVRWLGAQFPYLSANLDFSADPALAGLVTDQVLPNTAFRSTPFDLAAAAAAPKIAPSTVIERDGEMIGVVGATTPILQTISSPGDTTVIGPTEDDMPALAAVLQPAIDDLLDQGLNKIILVTHLQQLQLEEALIQLLHGVDVVIAGGSDTLLADDEDVERGLRPGDEAEGPYPIVTQNADGDPALIVSTDGEYSYVGRLVVEFDADGLVLVDSLDINVSGAFATTDDGVAALWGDDDAFADGTKADLVRQLTTAVDTVVTEKDGNTFGETAVFLEGRRGEVRTQETNLGNLTADANLWLAREADPTVMVSIKNGGGIRDAIGTIVEVEPGVFEEVPPVANPRSGKEEGEVSQLDIENALRFNNGLTILTLTAEQLKEVIEHGVAASGPGLTPGRFPQVGGVSFSFDTDKPAGERVQSLGITDDDGRVIDVIVENGELVGEAGRPIRMVTLDFLANGGDGFQFKTFTDAAPDFANRQELKDLLADPDSDVFAEPGSEQFAMAQYFATFFADTPFDQPDTPVEDDVRIQNLAFREDAVLAGVEDLVLVGGAEDDVLIGAAGADLLTGGAGDDVLIGFGGDDRLIGGPGNDFLDGGAGDDILIAGPGNNVLIGGPGNDFLISGPGDNVFVFRPGMNTDTISGFRSGDILDVSAFGFASADEVLDLAEFNRGRTVITLDAEAGDEIVLIGVRQGMLTGNDFFLGGDSDGF